MKVLFVTHGSEIYGANLSLLSLIDGLTGEGIACSVMSPWSGDLLRDLKARQVECSQLGYAWWLSGEFSLVNRIRRLRVNLGRLQQAANLARDLQPDVIYSNTSVSPFGALLANRLGLPHVWHLREFGDLDHGLRFDWGRAVHRSIISRAAAIVCVSEAVQDYLVSPRARARTRVIYNGVFSSGEFDLNRQNRCSTPRPGCEFTFVIAGALRPGKQQDLAIRGLGLVRSTGRMAKLLVLGDGEPDYVAHCRTIAAICGVGDCVEFLGYSAQPFSTYLQADAALMCSRCEGMGRVTAEAMAAVLPVIGTDSGGTRELIRHEETGMLFKGSVDDLAACMIRLIDAPEWARVLGINAWEHARERFSIGKYVREVQSVIRSVVT